MFASSSPAVTGTHKDHSRTPRLGWNVFNSAKGNSQQKVLQHFSPAHAKKARISTALIPIFIQ